MNTYTKTQLLQMNSDPKYGINWITNLENIKNTEKVKLYPTGNCSISAGKIYVALPSNKILTQNDISKYNIWN